MEMLRDELNRLLFQATEHDGHDHMEFMAVKVECEGNATEVLRRTSEALAMILSFQLVFDHTWSDEFIDTTECFEPLEQWFKKHAHTPIEDEYYFLNSENLTYFNEGRDWFWWSAEVKNKDMLIVYIKLQGFPVSGFDDLRRLLQTCGASYAEQGDCLELSDLYQDDIPRKGFKFWPFK